MQCFYSEYFVKPIKSECLNHLILSSVQQLEYVFETAVVNEIRKQCSLLSPMPNMYHWRTHREAEVDVLLERDGIFYPIEIKATARPSRRDTSGIRAFRSTYPDIKIAKGLVVAPTEAFIQLSEDDYAMPWDFCGTAG